jgi:hypothetical protein
MGKLILILALSVFMCSMLIAQSEKQGVTVNLEGQLLATANATDLFISIGGPALKFNFPNFTIGLDMYPSLRFRYPVTKLLVSPVLGFGPQLNFLKNKRFVVAFPCYYYSSSSTKYWLATAGIGYVFTKPRKQ